MTEKISWGLMGPGKITQTIATEFALAGIEFSAVGSRDATRAKKFADTHGVPRHYGSYEELVADDELDVIYIASTQNAHFENTALALSAGKHVLVEKPFMLTGSQARQIAALAKQQQLFLMEAMWTRFLPHMIRIREILNSGQLGEIAAVEASHSQRLPADYAPRLHSLQLGGGGLLDLGVYPLAFFQEVLGTPIKIAAVGSLTETGVDNNVSASLLYESGAVASMHTSLQGTGPVTASITGSLGRIEISGNWYEQAEFKRYKNKTDLVEHFTDKSVGRGMQHQAVEVERCIAAGLVESPVMPLADSVAIAETLDQIRGQIGLRYPGE